MDTTDKMIEDFKKALDSMPQDEFEKMVQEIDAMKMTGPTVEEYFDHISGSPRKIATLQKEVAELRERNEELEDITALDKARARVTALTLERQRLRDAVNILYDQALKNMNGAIGAEEVAVATYWDGQKDGLSIVIDLLESGSGKEETNKEAK